MLQNRPHTADSGSGLVERYFPACRVWAPLVKLPRRQNQWALPNLAVTPPPPPPPPKPTHLHLRHTSSSSLLGQEDSGWSAPHALPLRLFSPPPQHRLFRAHFVQLFWPLVVPEK
ncbi:unnamed protein product [Closterium sp. NIES-53]